MSSFPASVVQAFGQDPLRQTALMIPSSAETNELVVQDILAHCTLIQERIKALQELNKGGSQKLLRMLADNEAAINKIRAALS